jgi:hypothetical protein
MAEKPGFFLLDLDDGRQKPGFSGAPADACPDMRPTLLSPLAPWLKNPVSPRPCGSQGTNTTQT